MFFLPFAQDFDVSMGPPFLEELTGEELSDDTILAGDDGYGGFGGFIDDCVCDGYK